MHQQAKSMVTPLFHPRAKITTEMLIALDQDHVTMKEKDVLKQFFTHLEMM